MRVAIVGSRSWAQWTPIQSYVASLAAGTTVVSGGALGADQMAALVARRAGFLVEEIVPDYAEYGAKAPLVRNREIAVACDRMVAFWDGKSTGTAHAIACARALGKPVEVIRA